MPSVEDASERERERDNEPHAIRAPPRPGPQLPQPLAVDPHRRTDGANQISIDKVRALFVAPDHTQPTSVPPDTAAHDVARLPAAEDRQHS